MITAEIKQFIFDNYHDMYTIDLVKAINNKFGTNVTLSAVKNVKHRNGLKGAKPRGGRKGCTVWNAGLKKGDKRLKNMEKTWFKNGHQSYKEYEVGTESIKDGFVIVKQEDGTWKRKSHIVWEQHHGRPVPDKHIIVHADGNKLNFDIDNLIIMDWAVLIRMVKKGRFNADADITKCGVLISQIEQEIYKKKKEKK